MTMAKTTSFCPGASSGRFLKIQAYPFETPERIFGIAYLAEDIFDFAAKAPRRSLIEPFFDVGELFQQSFLFAGQSSRCDDGSDHKKVAASVALQGDDAFAFDAENGAGLCAFRDGQNLLAVQRGNPYLSAEGGLRESDGNIDV